MFLFTPSNTYEKSLQNSWKNSKLCIGFYTQGKKKGKKKGHRYLLLFLLFCMNRWANCSGCGSGELKQPLMGQACSPEHGPEQGWSRARHSLEPCLVSVLDGALTCLGNWMLALLSLQGLSNLVGMPLDVLLFRSSGTVSSIFS